jgi:hypothetical protein
MPVQPLPKGTAGAGCVDRVAWLLRVNRVFGAKFVDGRRFAALARIGESTISRLELHETVANHRHLRLYEQRLGLPSNHLVAVADALYREHGSAPPARPVAKMAPDDLLDRAMSGATMSGADWDTLTVGLLAGRPRRRPWEAICHRLLAEMTIAEGNEWRLRATAQDRLVRASRSSAPALSVCAAIAMDPAGQVIVEPLGVLESSSLHQASAYVLAALDRPIHDNALQGAWWAAAEKANRGHFTGEARKRLLRRAVVAFTDDDRPGIRATAAEVLRALEPSTEMGSTIRRDDIAASVFASGRLQHDPSAVGRVSRIVREAQSNLPRDVFDSDPIFAGLVEELLLAPTISARLTAAHVIEASPYRVPLARALTGELRRRNTLDNRLVEPIVRAVGVLGDPADRRIVEDLCLDPATPGPLAETAIWVLGHTRGTSGEDFWARAAGHLARTSEHAARGVVYVAGVERRTDLLGRFRDDPQLPAPARQAAGWWLDRPSHVLASTDRRTVASGW